MSATKLQLRTALGFVYRDVLPNPPRDCTPDEIPVIDLSPLFSEELSERQDVAAQIRKASVNTGFFYVRNHGIPAETIAKCKEQGLRFMRQPAEQKDLISSRNCSKHFNGYTGSAKTNISPTESIDIRESFSFRYSPELDPDHPMDVSELPEEVSQGIQGEDFVWEGTAHLPNFKEDCVAYWASCLRLARKLVRSFALSLDLEEHYWDDKVTHPGADSVFNYYRPRTEQETKDNSVGLGSHTDLQMFTLLWQDNIGGLQILSKEGQWIKAPPIEGTLVVNIGDYMMRLCNDIYISTVHRVTNESLLERVSMPFFFGLNFNCVEGVVPSCITDSNPAKYEPISAGEWVQKRFKQERKAFDEKAASSIAPSAVVVQT
ncbi:Clavaminate synthase-like protein [Apiospora kogelbergensis]|uniref:Clavaminate synthase-like protein n=1 Tax=Apiospora kogelbergensis TaxID=1337665 RepID=A0AAW0QDJ0_9PEZI